MRRPIRPGGFEAEGEEIGIDELQSARRQRRARHVAAEPLQPRPVLSNMPEDVHNHIKLGVVTLTPVGPIDKEFTITRVLLPIMV
jgi:hypothetical protein